jgi:tetratricopeptide (TPR) repeat protein
MEEEIKQADDLMRKGKSSLAVGVIKGALKEESGNPYLHYLLGIARMKCGRFFLAREALEKANQLLPRHPENLRSLGWVKVMLGQIEEGRNDIREAISLDLTDPLAYIDLAMSYFQYCDFKEGMEWLERGRALAPKDPFVLNNVKTAKEMEREYLRYSASKQHKIKQEKLNPEEQRSLRISILGNYSFTKPLTKDEAEEIKEEARLNGATAPIINNEEFFDDCPICRLMKAAKEQGKEPTAEELKGAFKKAKEGGAIIGGEWFEEKKK